MAKNGNCLCRFSFRRLRCACALILCIDKVVLPVKIGLSLTNMRTFKANHGGRGKLILSTYLIK